MPLCSSAEYNRILGAVRCDSDGIFRVWLTATPLSLVGRIIAQTMTSGALTGVVTEQANPVLPNSLKSRNWRKLQHDQHRRQVWNAALSDGAIIHKEKQGYCFAAARTWDVL
ncbi:MAG: hypothetical protein DMG97_10705 [Acidobacteria bacterium]|nr:MAG: hypothetical protein DMG97_10705 [Acidobacteriota bacterium]